MKIAVEGCCHGELDKIYETLQYIEKKDNIKIDLLLICGDFQSVRNRSDLQAMAVPPKYQRLNTFYKYYSGEKMAPVITVFVGGNHEASNYLQELPYGGWVAPNIYYMGYGSVLRFGGLRIGGISGIYKGKDYNRGHFEHPPYNEESKRSAYHVRNLEVFRFKQLKQPVDIMMSHDWPRGIYHYGNTGQLLKRKPFFREEVEMGTLGSPAAEELLHAIKPDYWFSAHLHVKFSCVVDHQVEDMGVERVTKFLALDKCLPRRQFLQVLDIPKKDDGPLQLELDPEWLCLLKSTNHLLHLGKGNRFMPGPGCEERYDFTVTDEDLLALRDDFDDLFKIPENFDHTASPHKDSDPKKNLPAPQMCINPQTTLLCEMLGLTNPFAVFSGRQVHTNTFVHNDICGSGADTSGELEDEGVAPDSDFINSTIDSSLLNSTIETSVNPEEISLDEIKASPVLAGSDDVALKFPSPSCFRTRLTFNSTPSSLNPDESLDEIVDESTDDDKSISSVGTPSSEQDDTSDAEPGSKRLSDTNLEVDFPSPSSSHRKFKRRNQAVNSSNGES